MIKTAAVFLILIFSGLTTDCHAASCSELGYTKTSTSGCLGYVLKCPTDESKIFCFTREEIVKKLMPDWSSAQSKTSSNSYSWMSANGWVHIISAKGVNAFDSYVSNSYSGGLNILHAYGKGGGWEDYNSTFFQSKAAIMSEPAAAAPCCLFRLKTKPIFLSSALWRRRGRHR